MLACRYRNYKYNTLIAIKLCMDYMQIVQILQKNNYKMYVH